MKSCIAIIALCLLIISCKKEAAPSQTGSDATSFVEKRDSITANYRFNQIASAAFAMDSTVKFKGITGNNLNLNGTSRSWSYRFGKSVSPFSYYHFTAVYDSMKYDSVSNSTVGDAIITHSWMNSCDAMVIAEANGGIQFRASNPNFVVQAHLSEPGVPYASTFWYITYQSTINPSIYLSLHINATTGTVE